MQYKINPTHIICIISLLLCACASDINPDAESQGQITIYPDYTGTTVPYNIAPLNFHIDGDGDYAALFEYAGQRICVKAKESDIVIPINAWKEMLAKSVGDSVKVTICQKEGERWTAYSPWYIHVKADAVDPTLVYRKIPPLYGTWREIGIYQRDLESYEEKAVYENTAYHGNCVNCHSLCSRDPQRILFHLRGPGGATYIKIDGEALKLDTKTAETISNFTYPYWHPSGRYVAFSVNDIFQIFHTTDPNRTEVIDDDSDVIVYDISRNETFSCEHLKSDSALETFPAFSADGRRLYFCSAEKPDTLPEQYSQVRYSLCAIDFDPDTRKFGEKVDTLHNALAADSAGRYWSMSVPRPSPDGQRLVATRSAYGQFMIWHKDADLWMYDIATGTWSPMTAANSEDVESYHGWSDNSRWMVFSSRRDDGLYTRPYIAYVAEDGTVGKPFMLPQKYPKKYYTDEENSYNIPEFSTGEVNIDSRSVVDWIECEATQVKFAQ